MARWHSGQYLGKSEHLLYSLDSEQICLNVFTNEHPLYIYPVSTRHVYNVGLASKALGRCCINVIQTHVLCYLK